MEILFVSLGNLDPGESRTQWAPARGNAWYSLATLLDQFWCAEPCSEADGPSIAVRFVDEHGNRV